jgi:hypothetical protein
VSQAESRYTSQQMTADFDILRSALISGDPGIYRFTQRTELAAEFSGVHARLYRPMNTEEFYREIAPAVVAIKNGHTHLDWPEGFVRFRPLVSDRMVISGLVRADIARAARASWASESSCQKNDFATVLKRKGLQGETAFTLAAKQMFVAK